MNFSGRSLSVGYAPSTNASAKGSLVVRSDDSTLMGVVPMSGTAHAQSLAPAVRGFNGRPIVAEEARVESVDNDANGASAYSRQKCGKKCADDSGACDAFRDFENQNCDSDFDREIARAEGIQNGANGVPGLQQLAAGWAYAIQTSAIEKRRTCRQSSLVNWVNCAFGC